MKLSKMHQRVLSKAPYQRSVTDAPTKREEGRHGQWGWEGPNKADKGQRNGSCNRTACQRPGAYWWNRGSSSWYCTTCAGMINYPSKDEPLCTLDDEAYQEYWASYEPN